jgi:hypothetical protein
VSYDRSPIPVGVRTLVCGVGLALLAIGTRCYLVDHPNGANVMMIVGAFLFVLGPLLDRVRELAMGPKGLSGKFESTPAAIVAAEEQSVDGDVKELTAAGEVKTVTADFSGEGSLTAEAHAGGEEVVTQAENRVVITDGAVAVYEQLSDEDRAAVRSVVQEMKSPGFADGVLLQGSANYMVCEANGNVRLVYRRRDRSVKGDPPGYVILNVVRPGTTLWKMTERALP